MVNGARMAIINAHPICHMIDFFVVCANLPSRCLILENMTPLSPSLFAGLQDLYKGDEKIEEKSQMADGPCIPKQTPGSDRFLETWPTEAQYRNQRRTKWGMQESRSNPQGIPLLSVRVSPSLTLDDDCYLRQVTFIQAVYPYWQCHPLIKTQLVRTEKPCLPLRAILPLARRLP